jgi:hypothetical protein
MIRVSNLKFIFLVPLFFLMTIAPQLFSFIKLPLLLFSFFLIFITIVPQKKLYSKKYVIWFVFYLTYYLIWISYGALRGNPGIYDYFRVQVLWPIFYFILISSISSLGIISMIFKFLIVFTTIISIYLFYKFFEIINLVPPIINFEGESFAIGIHSGYIQIVSLSIGSLTFLMPFIIVFVSNYNDQYNNILSKSKAYIILFMTIITTLLTGRRALWGSLFIIYFLNWIINSNFLKKEMFYNNIKKPLIFLTILILIFTTAFFLLKDSIDYENLTNRLVEEFKTENTTPRQLQSNALINGFYNYPLFGSGFGIGVKDVVRSTERPWTYELTYHLYLFNTGIIGSLFFLILLSFPIYRFFILKKYHPEYNIFTKPLILSYIIVLFASSSNPYFTSSFDFLWMLFLPIGVLNRLEIESKNKSFNANF